jgi:hypothetical protein
VSINTEDDEDRDHEAGIDDVHIPEILLMIEKDPEVQEEIAEKNPDEIVRQAEITDEDDREHLRNHEKKDPIQETEKLLKMIRENGNTTCKLK